jgi:hypothetical protein
MTAFFTHFSKNSLPNQLVNAFVAVLLSLASLGTFAQSSAELSQIHVEQLEEELLVSTQIAFELPTAVEEALLKGIPMYFVLQADITKERWYWYDKKVISAERHMRIAYQPLTRKWRLNVGSGSDRSTINGLVLNQSFDSLEQALTVIKKVFRWKVADAGNVDDSGRHKLALSFRLDLSQLPRPFQIGAIGQSDWDVGASIVTPLVVEKNK